MTSQLEGLGVVFEIIDSVDGRSLTRESVPEYSQSGAHESMGRDMSLKEIGCTLSHMGLWRRMVEEGLDEVLILEDDIRVGHAVLDVIAHRDRFPSDYDLINFHTDTGQIPFGPVLTDIYRAARHHGHANGLCCYLLKLSGARKLYAAAYPMRMVSDELTGRTHLTGLISYGVYPRTAALAEVESSIWKVEGIPGSTAIRKKVFLLTQIWYLLLELLELRPIGRFLKRSWRRVRAKLDGTEPDLGR